MLEPVAFILIALVLIALLGVLGVVLGVRRSATPGSSPRASAPRASVPEALTPQQLAALAQPYRRLLGEAQAIERELAAEARRAPSGLEHELGTLAWRLGTLNARALARGERGTELAARLLNLGPDDPQRPATLEAAARLEAELEGFVASARALRGKVYGLLEHSARLGADDRLGRDLDDALLEVGALEEAFAEVGEELGGA